LLQHVSVYINHHQGALILCFAKVTMLTSVTIIVMCSYRYRGCIFCSALLCVWIVAQCTIHTHNQCCQFHSASFIPEVLVLHTDRRFYVASFLRTIPRLLTAFSFWSNKFIEEFFKVQFSPHRKHNPSTKSDRLMPFETTSAHCSHHTENIEYGNSELQQIGHMITTLL